MSTWRAHAKLTMSLHVTGVRDDGYHLIDAEMVSLELHDLLSFEPCAPRADPTLTAIGPFADGVPTDGTNLVARALALTGSRAATTIDKRIPHGGGLGGGSTDAATALRWGGFGTSPSELERAGRLGADIPFCLVGGRARVSGIGERVEPLPHVARTVTLVIPPLHVSTPAVYRAWDDLGRAPVEPADGGHRNDLERAAIAVEPELARWRRLIHERIDRAPTLAGSGATWFVDGAVERELADLATHGATVLVTHTVDAGRATGPGT
jgi:4-diphosphocytidyl-2-C-methyl-D-erythritol kinase